MDTHREGRVRTIDPRQLSRARHNLPAGRSDLRSISPATVISIQRVVDIFNIMTTGLVTAAWFPSVPFPSAWSWSRIFWAALAAIVFVNVAHVFATYRKKLLSAPLLSLGVALATWFVAFGMMALLVRSVSSSLPSLEDWLASWAVGVAAILALSHGLVGLLFRRWQRTGRLRLTAAIVGAGPIGQRLVQKLTSTLESDVRIIGVYDDRIARLPRFCFGQPIRGNIDDLLRTARATRIDCVFVAMPLAADWRLAEIMNKLCLIPVDVRLCVDSFGFQIGECDVTHIGGLTTLDVCNRPLRGWRHLAKLVEDKVLAVIILALVAPIMAAVAILIRLDSPGPILFRQKRHGLNNKLIEVLKFRTLYDDACDANAERLCSGDDPRVTRVGAFLRRTMIDELPQFINVLRGDMSIVGPRPHALAAKAGGLLYHEAVKYYDARHRMKPGITGWAQVNGWRGETRNVEEIDQRVAHDLYYIRNWSITLDMKIILRTALGAATAFLPRKPKDPIDDAVPLANARRSRSAA